MGVEWKIRDIRKSTYVIPVEPDTTSAEDEADESTPRPETESQPKVVFENSAHDKRDVFWVSPDKGEETSLGEIAAGDKMEFNSFVGHKFRIRQAGGALVKEHIVRDVRFETVVLGKFDRLDL